MKNPRGLILISLAAVGYTCGGPREMVEPGPFSNLHSPYLGEDPPGLVPEIFAQGIISTERDEAGLTISSAGDEVIFWTVEATDGVEVPGTTMMIAREEAESWTDPEPAPFSGPYQDMYPALSPDGSRLFFQSDRPVDSLESRFKYNIWYVDRTGDGWGEPRSIGRPINGPNHTGGPSATVDGTLYYTVMDIERGRSELFRSAYLDGVYQKPERLPDHVNAFRQNTDSFVDPLGPYLIFTAFEGQGHADNPGGLFITFHGDGGRWTDPVRLGPAINTEDQFGSVTISGDGKYLFFVRINEEVADGGRMGWDLYWVDAAIVREVDGRFTSSITVPFALDHNRMLVEGEVQGTDGNWVPVRFWVDSGNPEFFVSPALAQKLGLHPWALEEPDDATSRMIPVPPPGVRIAGMDLDLTEVEASLVFEPTWLFSATGADANLPSTILKHYQVVFDYPAGEMTLAAPGTLPHEGIRVPAVVHPRTGIPQVEAVIGTDTLGFALDMGASYSFTSSEELDEITKASPDWPSMVGAVGHANMWGWLPGEEEWRVVRIPQMKVGDVTLQKVGMVGQSPYPDGSDLGFWYSQKTASPVVGFLGPNALKPFRVEIDYPNQMVYLERTAEPAPTEMDLVGLTLRQDSDGSFRVTGIATLNGTVATPGVRAGDRLLKVDSLEASGSTMGTVVDALRGCPGEMHLLELERGGDTIRVEATVHRFLSGASEEGIPPHSGIASPWTSGRMNRSTMFEFNPPGEQGGLNR